MSDEPEVITLSSDDEVEVEPNVKIELLVPPINIKRKSSSHDENPDKKFKSEEDCLKELTQGDDDEPHLVEKAVGGEDGNNSNSNANNATGLTGALNNTEVIVVDDGETPSTSTSVHNGANGNVENVSLDQRFEQFLTKLKAEAEKQVDDRNCTPQGSAKIVSKLRNEWTIIGESSLREVNKTKVVEILFPATFEKMAKDPSKKFVYISKLLNDMKKSVETQNLVCKLERKLAELEKRIEEWDNREVDLDDDTNSAYLVKSRMVKRYIDYYHKLCDIHNSEYYTDRPTQKQLNLSNVTEFPVLNEAIQKFMNQKGCDYVPDYSTIVSVVSKLNGSIANSSFYLNPSQIEATCRKILEYIVNKRRFRLKKEVDFNLKMDECPPDPADSDPELAKKLAENVALAKSELSVIDIFAKKQDDQKAVAVEVSDENSDESPDEFDEDEESVEDIIEVESSDVPTELDDDDFIVSNDVVGTPPPEENNDDDDDDCIILDSDTEEEEEGNGEADVDDVTLVDPDTEEKLLADTDDEDADVPKNNEETKSNDTDETASTADPV